MTKVTKTVEIRIKLIDDKLFLESDYTKQDTIGTQGDHHVQLLEFARPEGFEDIDMWLSFIDGNKEKFSIPIKGESSYLIPNALTQTTSMQLGIAFTDSDTWKAGSNTLTFGYRKYSGDGILPEPLPLPPYIMPDAPLDGKTYGRKDGKWVEVTGGGGIGVQVVQTTGTSTTAVMSQNAVTKELNALPNQYATKAQGAKADTALQPSGTGTDLTATFNQTATRANLVSGEKLSTIFGKVMRWFSDLKMVAWTGVYADLSGKPTSLPADGGNAATVGGKAPSAFATAAQGGKADTALQSESDPVYKAEKSTLALKTDLTGFIKTESDPTVPAWAKTTNKPTYTASEVGALPTSGKAADSAKLNGKSESDFATSAQGLLAQTALQIESDPVYTADKPNLALKTDLTGYIKTETDPTVPSWAKASSKPSYTAAEVGALPTSGKAADSAKLNGKSESDFATSAQGLLAQTALQTETDPVYKAEKSTLALKTDLTGFIKTESDPTVPSWAKAANKPTYTASEVGALGATAQALDSAKLGGVAASDFERNPTIVPSAVSSASIAVAANTVYTFGALTALTITSAAVSFQESIVTFSSGATATVLTLPSALKVIGSTDIEANKSYIMAIMNGFAVIGGA